MTKRKQPKSTAKNPDQKKQGVKKIVTALNVQFIRFVVVGTLNTAFSYGIYALLLYLGIEYKLANLGSLLASIAVGFKAHGKFVFNNADNSLFLRFFIGWLVIYGFNIFIIGQLLKWGFNAYESGAMALPPVVLCSYFLQKLIVFKPKKNPSKAPLAANAPAVTLPSVFMKTHLAIVVPCYNEEDVLPETNSRLLALMATMRESGLISENSAIYYVDDGSRDKTWTLISQFNADSPYVHGVKLSRNQGHQNALLAGLFAAEGEAIVSIDADLQDDINVIKDMVHLYNDNNEIVYGVRSSRKSDTFFKRVTAQLYYRILMSMGVDIVFNHADYRLMSRRVIDCLRQYSEVNLFLRGIIPKLGFRTATVYYERTERFAGESKYPLSKMLALAAEGITSFSVMPLRFITWLGFLVSLGSLFMVVWIIIGKFAMQSTIPGWASSVLPIYFIGGIQLLSIGILGEYLAKIYMEVKQRPRYFIEENI